jgi:hypothetical protein
MTIEYERPPVCTALFHRTVNLPTVLVGLQVTADALSSCAVGAAPGGAEEHLAATVELLRGPDGLWRVAQRLY